MTKQIETELNAYLNIWSQKIWQRPIIMFGQYVFSYIGTLILSDIEVDFYCRENNALILRIEVYTHKHIVEYPLLSESKFNISDPELFIKLEEHINDCRRR